VEEHEAALGAWKGRFKAAALRQLSDRERSLGEWEAHLQGQETEAEKRGKALSAKEAAAAKKLAEVR